MTYADLADLAREQRQRFIEPAKPSPVLVSLDRFLSLQRLRATTTATRIVERYQRRLKELEPADHVESRGLSQPWHRDSADWYREIGE